MERIDIQNIRGQCKPADIITPYRGNYRSVWDNQEGEHGSARACPRARGGPRKNSRTAAYGKGARGAVIVVIPRVGTRAKMRTGERDD